MDDLHATCPGESGAIEDSYPVTPLQHGMLLHGLRARGTGVDLEQLVCEMNEPLDLEAFRRAWGIIAKRHAVLRTRFAWADRDAPVQEVLRAIDTPFTVTDLRERDREDPRGTLEAFLSSDRARGFDLATAPLWRVAMFRLGDERWRMVWTYSHALLDNAFAFVLSEVEAAYEAERSGRTALFEERRPYRDHCVWLSEHLARTRDDAKKFYREMLAGFTTPTSLGWLARETTDSGSPRLPVKAASAEDGTFAGYETLSFRLSRETSDALRRLKEGEGVGVSVAVEAAWALVLAAFEGTDDVVFGLTRHCRRSSVEGAEAMVGLLINTLPVRVKIDPGAPLVGWLRELRRQQEAIRPFESTALVDVLSTSDVARETPLFDTLLVYNDAHADVRMKAHGAPWSDRTIELHDQVNFPCSLMGYGDAEIHFRIEYDPRRFAEDSMARVASLAKSILEAIARDPRVSVGDLPRLPDEDARRVLADWVPPRVPLEGDPCVHHQIEKAVATWKDSVALVFRGASLTYGELNARANRVARRLRAMGVGPGALVGIFVERSLEMVVGLLGILKAGAAYVPIDPAYPAERVAMMLEDAKAGVVVTLSKLAGALPPSAAPRIVALDAMDVTGDDSTPDVAMNGEELAYTIFTSGSSGRPKGVLVRHRNVTHFFEGMDRAIGTTPGVWLALTSISFDIAALEILWTLARGFTVVIQEEADGSAKRRPESRSRAHAIDFSLFYFAAEANAQGAAAYRLLLEGSKFADAHGFAAVWTPERHFHPFGGLYPNPCVTGAAVAAVTQHIGVRAGSVVLPLHNPIRCAEEWSVVDNLSNGRVGLSFASGWHAADFALMPENFQDRRKLMAEGIETVRKLWRGDAVRVKSGDGKEIEIHIFPRPIQKEPPIWITASGSPDTFAMAGRIGANVLTNLLVMKREELAKNVAVYREARAAAGHPGTGHVSLMLHTFVGDDPETVRETVRGPFLTYLRTSTDLINKTHWELTAFAKPSGQRTATEGARDLGELTPDETEAIMEHAFARYFATAGLFGTPQSCAAKLDELAEIGVDEIACLIDFGVPTDVVLSHLRHLDELKTRCNAEAPAEGADDDFSIAAQVKRYGVTHLQCTPSMATLLLGEPGGLEALLSLSTLLLGGEALPASLIDRLRPRMNGRILNMYGPTETTIWSTFADVSKVDGAPIVIGRPIANTRAYVVDRHRRPAPIGVPGELVLGGEGVARGYLDRPEMTAERFVPDVFSGQDGERLYRTGDLARWRHDATLEFLGRLDHQVKIRGHRIELGEIESTLARHAALREVVVTARREPEGEPRLVAYVLLRHEDGSNDEAANVEEWRRIWNETYEKTADSTALPEAMFDTAGWSSSYTQKAIPEEEMRAWIDETASRVAELEPRRLLDIGCGTGLVLFRVAPACERYVGIDASGTALRRLDAKLEAAGLKSVVSLRELKAEDIDQLGDERFDTIVLNSVAQYFPDVTYFTRVLEKAFARLTPGGAMFIGDVRSLPLMTAFHHSVELYKAPAGLPAREVAARASRRADQERELAFDPRLFRALRKTMPELVDVELRLKDGAYANEMTRFRYDVVLRKAGASDAPVEAPPVDAPEPCTLESLREILQRAGSAVRIVGIPNARVRDDVRAIDLLARGSGGDTAGELRSTVRALPAKGISPSAVLDLDPAFEVFTTWSSAGIDRFDVIARRRADGPRAVVVAPLATDDDRPLATYANSPARGVERGALAAELRTYLRGKLPEFMLPSAFVVLEKFPLTPNGKVDRNALPAPDRARVESTAAYVAPEGDVEQAIARIWQDMLSMDRVGVDQNFFDLGANSLMMVQANGRLSAALGKDVSLVDLFRFPTVRALAAHVSGGDAADAESLKESRDRARARQDAISKRREARRGVLHKQ